MLFVGLPMKPAFSGVCGQTEQVRLGPVPVDDSVAGIRFNYINTSKKIAKVTANFYTDGNILVDTQTETIEPGKGFVFLMGGDGDDSIFVIADVTFEVPVFAQGFEVPVFMDGLASFEVPVFLTSLETYDDTGRTGIWGTDGTAIWGTDGTAIWGTNGTSINPASKPENILSVNSKSKTAIAFPPLTVGPGESVQLAVTNAADNADGKAYLQLVDMESGQSAIDDNFCLPVFCGKTVCNFICGPKSIPTGGKLEVEYVNNTQEPTTILPVVKDFEVPVFSESFEVPVFSQGFEVPVFMPTMTLRSETGQVKFYRGAAGKLTPSSCQ